MTGLLADDPPALEHLGLTTDLVSKAIVEVLEGVDVLELGLRAKLRRATAAQRDVAVGT